MSDGRFMINFDADGVAFDFDGHVHSVTRAKGHARRPKDMTTEELWEVVHGHEDFWVTMPELDGFRPMLEFARPFGVRFITGVPPVNYDKVQHQKRQHIAKIFGSDIPVVTCRAKDKSNHMQQPGDILVDDFVANTKRWTRAGGTAILYRNPVQGLIDLKAAVANLR